MKRVWICNECNYKQFGSEKTGEGHDPIDFKCQGTLEPYVSVDNLTGEIQKIWEKFKANFECSDSDSEQKKLVRLSNFVWVCKFKTSILKTVKQEG